jgi:hypothetical protein
MPSGDQGSYAELIFHYAGNLEGEFSAARSARAEGHAVKKSGLRLREKFQRAEKAAAGIVPLGREDSR